MNQSFFFYDLETSGLKPREDRIMQFAGQRTDMELNPIGEPVNILVKMTDDALPSPFTINVTKITPQDTLRDGLSEAEFCKYVTEEVFTPNTIAVGYNTVRLALRLQGFSLNRFLVEASFYPRWRLATKK